MGYESNPLLTVLDPHKLEVLQTIYRIIYSAIDSIGGLRPDALSCPLVSKSRSEGQDRYLQYRHIAHWDLPRITEEQMDALEDLARYIHAPNKIQCRSHPLGGKRPASKYVTWNAGVSETTIGYLLKDWGFQEAGSTGIWVCRKFLTKEQASQRSKDGNWLYDGRALVEIREQHDIRELDFAQRVVQTAYILNHGKPYPYANLIYALYRDLSRIGLRAVTSEDIAGLEEIIEFMKWTLFASGNNKDAARYFGCKPESVVLAGVKGTGKTLIAEALATGDYKTLFIPLSAMQLVLDKRTQLSRPNRVEDEGSILAAIEDLREKSGAEVIIHCDDIEALLFDANGSSDGQHAATSNWLNNLSGIQRSGILLSGSTNDPYLIDHRFLRPGRIGYVLHVPLPDLKIRDAILAIHTRAKPLASEVTIHALAQATEGYTPAALAEICNRAGHFALQRAAARKAGSRDTFEALSGLVEADYSGVTISSDDFGKALSLVSRHTNPAENKKEDRRIKKFCDAYSSIGFRA
ncbi:ATP-binding protein [Candidatus Woesearchaeota archaeon]|nr:ATP-binding protein [Candidatus Woesearchaeota archaeon]